MRAFLYSAVATILALLIAYPLAYAIAFRRRPLEERHVAGGDRPFFTTYLIRTLAWETILSDNGFVVNTLQTFGVISNDGRLLATTPAVIAGLTYNFLPFMVLPIYASLERIDASLIEAAKGPLRLLAQGVSQGHAAPLDAGSRRRHVAHLHPCDRRLHQRPVPRRRQQAMIGNVIQSLYLKQTDYPAAAALSFILMAAILALVFIYIRFAGSEALMGEEIGGADVVE